MDPIRYPEFERDDTETPESTKKRLFSNIAERCAVELFRMERLAQEFEHLRDELEPFSVEMRKLVTRARSVERETVCSRSNARQLSVVDRYVSEDANRLIGHALKTFGAIEFLFENPLPFATKNFYTRESGVGRWTGPGQVSTIDIELSELVTFGLKRIDIVFSHTQCGPPPTSVKVFCGKRLMPIGAEHIHWPSALWAQIDVESMVGCGGGLTIMTRSTAKPPSDPRFLGVAVKSLGFSS
jgi:hypothetical protein